MTFVKHDVRNYGQSPNIYGDKYSPRHNSTLTLRDGVAGQMLGIPRFKDEDTMDLIDRAKTKMKNRVPVLDRATAIALLLS